LAKINFEEDERLFCKTICPYGIKFRGFSIKVGSRYCEDLCKHFQEINDNEKFVICNYEERE
jgi:hypothetical protein